MPKFVDLSYNTLNDQLKHYQVRLSLFPNQLNMSMFQKNLQSSTDQCSSSIIQLVRLQEEVTHSIKSCKGNKRYVLRKF